MLACVQIDSCSLIEFGKCCEEEGKKTSHLFVSMVVLYVLI